MGLDWFSLLCFVLLFHFELSSWVFGLGVSLPGFRIFDAPHLFDLLDSQIKNLPNFFCLLNIKNPYFLCFMLTNRILRTDHLMGSDVFVDVGDVLIILQHTILFENFILIIGLARRFGYDFTGLELDEPFLEIPEFLEIGSGVMLDDIPNHLVQPHRQRHLKQPPPAQQRIYRPIDNDPRERILTLQQPPEHMKHLLFFLKPINTFRPTTQIQQCRHNVFDDDFGEFLEMVFEELQVELYDAVVDHLQFHVLSDGKDLQHGD